MDEYARFAFLYDFIVRAPLRPVHTAMAETVCSHNGLTVADLCCGTGLFVGLARKAGLIPSGVDISAEMLAIARHKYSSVDFLEADATQTPYESCSFDAATMSFALHEKPAPVALGILEEAMRITRPGGVVVVGDYRLPTEANSRFPGVGIGLVEWLAGREHYACFKAYMDAGGTKAFLERAGLSARLVKTHMYGWAGVYTVERT